MTMAKQPPAATPAPATPTPAELAEQLSAELDAALPDLPAPPPGPAPEAEPAERDPEAEAEAGPYRRRMAPEIALLAKTADAWASAFHRRGLETALAAELVKGINPKDAAAAAELYKRVQIVMQPFVVAWDVQDRVTNAEIQAELAAALEH
jgi:hypothetical protein